MRPPRSALRLGTLALALASAALAGCPLVAMVGVVQSASVYPAGRMLAHGHSHRVGCVEVATSLYENGSREPRLEFEFGNRCDARTSVALGAARVWLHEPGSPGVDRVFTPYDPNHEIRAASLDARSTGREVIAYLDAEGFDDVAVQSARGARAICVDVAPIAHGAAAAIDCFPLVAPPPSQLDAFDRLAR